MGGGVEGLMGWGVEGLMGGEVEGLIGKSKKLKVESLKKKV